MGLSVLVALASGGAAGLGYGLRGVMGTGAIPLIQALRLARSWRCLPHDDSRGLPRRQRPQGPGNRPRLRTRVPALDGELMPNQAGVHARSGIALVAALVVGCSTPSPSSSTRPQSPSAVATASPSWSTPPSMLPSQW